MTLGIPVMIIILVVLVYMVYAYSTGKMGQGFSNMGGT